MPVSYDARATFVTRLNNTFIDRNADLLSRSTEISTTFSEVAKSRRIKLAAGQELGLNSGQIRSVTVDSRVIPGTNIIEISARGPDAVVARDYANVVGELTTIYVNDLYEVFELVLLDQALPRRPAAH
jgi:capsular polysaccharide biosynthesis protein